MTLPQAFELALPLYLLILIGYLLARFSHALQGPIGTALLLSTIGSAVTVPLVLLTTRPGRMKEGRRWSAVRRRLAAGGCGCILARLETGLPIRASLARRAAREQGSRYGQSLHPAHLPAGLATGTILRRPTGDT